MFIAVSQQYVQNQSPQKLFSFWWGFSMTYRFELLNSDCEINKTPIREVGHKNWGFVDSYSDPISPLDVYQRYIFKCEFKLNGWSLEHF